MTTFGIISEGPTDQIVLENIVCGYFNDADLNENIHFIQPLRDNTDKYGIAEQGGWFNVFEYCKSRRLLESFEQNDYIIIQIDTDRTEDKNYDVKKTNSEGIKYSPEELIGKVIEKFQQIFSMTFEEKYILFKNRIIYAICVEEIECWLLPLYYDDKTQSATNNCIYKLNEKIKNEFGFYIDPENKSKRGKEYDKLSISYSKNKILLASYKKNISLKVFIESLVSLNIKL